MSADVPAGDVRKILEATEQWSRTWGEDTPHDVKVVATNYSAAMQKIHGPKVTADDIPIYVVVARGDFSYLTTGGGTVRNGVWAVLYLEPVTFILRGFTVRAADDIPEVDLSSLGKVLPLPP
ncbi:hypothetical protein ACFWY6_03825 [Streptomyces sp. NPDC059037]|uniref:hypothetical protein n=1 Tax=Streptomyces sp. NPDC059037 TaxID=3346710 RepID=UPI0036B6E023